MAQNYGRVRGSKYPYQTVVLVPCTNGKRKITKSACRQRAQGVQKKMSNMFGGYTSTNSSGGYYSSKQKKLIKEDVIQVTAYSTKAKFRENKGKLLRYVSNKGKRWKQESMGIIIENDLIYI